MRRVAAANSELHAARIAVKRARYAAELAAPSSGKRMRKLVSSYKELQDVLGDHQDSVVARAWLRAAAQDGADAFVAGELAAIEAQAAAEARAAWPKAWKALSRKRLRFWV